MPLDFMLRILLVMCLMKFLVTILGLIDVQNQCHYLDNIFINSWMPCLINKLLKLFPKLNHCYTRIDKGHPKKAGGYNGQSWGQQSENST